MAQPRVHIVNIGLYRATSFLSETIRPWSLDIWYVVSLSGPLPNLFKIYCWGQKWPRLRGHMFYKGLYGEDMKKNLLV